MSFTVFILVYFVILMAVLVAMVKWQKRNRRPKLPFRTERDKLLRGPGEHLQQEMERMSEDMPFELAFVLIGPLLLGLGVIVGLGKLGIGSPGQQASLGFFLTLAALGLAAYPFVRKLISYGNHRLGWFGERMVAEELEPLKTAGWRIFHDVPFESGKTRFNIDHVAVGPGGVFAIETKMRRKGHARPGRKDHEVFYDGKELNWPWKEDAYGLEQAERNARTLQDWLQQMTGIPVQVGGVLVIPCWYVVEKARGPIRVVNESFLSGVLTARKGALTADQIDLVARQLEARCRNVEY